MTTMPLMGCVKNGTSGLLLTLIPTGAAQIPSWIPSPSIRTAPRCVWPVSAWPTGDTADKSIPENGAAHSPAAKWAPAPVRKNVPRLLTVDAFTQNRNGTSASIPLSPEGQRYIRRSTITALPASG